IDQGCQLAFVRYHPPAMKSAGGPSMTIGAGGGWRRSRPANGGLWRRNSPTSLSLPKSQMLTYRLPQDEQTKLRLRRGRMSPLLMPRLVSSPVARSPQEQAMPKGRLPQVAAVCPLSVDEAWIMRRTMAPLDV
ncbi:hypothetical protein, partial [Reyranella soli]|uniref:hypothetical protein n=1 Tax=Reyranella soli TaxID=1230389 RepID=UPI001C3FD9C1